MLRPYAFIHLQLNNFRYIQNELSAVESATNIHTEKEYAQMKPQMTRLILACLLFGLLTAAPFLHAQDATPEATAEGTVEATVDPEAESTQVLEIDTAPGSEEAETNSAIGDPPITSGEQPGDITSGSSLETPLPPQSGTTDETPEVGAIISAPEGEPPIAADLGAETQEAETSLEGAESTGDTEEAEAPAEGQSAPGITTLVLLLGVGAVFAVGLLTLTRGQYRGGGSDDDTDTPQ
jgi:hypothetical protein